MHKQNHETQKPAQKIQTQLDIWFGAWGGKLDTTVQWTDNEVSELRLALVTGGIEDAAQSKDQEARKEALEWIKSDSREPFSFVTCCYELNLEPEDLRNSFDRFIKKNLPETNTTSRPGAKNKQHAA